MNKERRIDIEDGKVVFGSTGFKKLIREANDGSYITILEPYSEEKTYRQIKFFHGPVVKEYSDYTGERKKDAKYTLKKRFGVNTLSKDVETGKQEIEVRSLADYTKEQMSVFLERILHFFEFECGFVIDAETRKKFIIDTDTGELQEISTN